MTTATKAKRFLAAVVLGTAAGPVWAQGGGGDPWGGASPQVVSASQLFQGISVQVVPGPSSAAPAAAGIRWRSETFSAFKEAVGQGKPLVIFFSDDNCEKCRGVCKNSETVARSFADPRMAAMADRAVFLRLDHGRLTPDEQQTFRSMDIKTLPTVAMIDTRNGRFVQVGQIVGAYEADAYVARFTDLMTRYTEGPGQAPPEAPRPPAAPPAPTYAPTASPAPAPASALATHFTPESVPGFLTGLGYEVKAMISSIGVPHWVVTTRRGDWTLMFDVSFSKDGEVLWLISPVGGRQIPDDPSLSAPALLGLLIANDEIGPLHFSIDRANRRICLNFAVPNQGLTPETLRNRIELFLDQIVKTQQLWTAAVNASTAQPRPIARN